MNTDAGQLKPEVGHSLPTHLPDRSLELKINPRGPGGWTRMDDRFKDEMTKLSLNLSNLSGRFLPLGSRGQDRNCLSLVSRK